MSDDEVYREMMKRKVMSHTPSETPKKLPEGVCTVDFVDPEKVEAARGDLSGDLDLQRTADAFRVLANPNRLRVLEALRGRELCVCDLREVLGISMSGTSQLLRELRNLGAVAFRTEGKLAYYRLADLDWLDLAQRVLDKLHGSAART